MNGTNRRQEDTVVDARVRKEFDNDLDDWMQHVTGEFQAVALTDKKRSLSEWLGDTMKKLTHGAGS